MADASLIELRNEMEQVRSKLYAVVKGDAKLLLDKEAYMVSTELDQLIVRLMKKELQKNKL